MLFLFLDGVGLGPDAPETNPLAALELPALERLAGGHKWTSRAPRTQEEQLVFRPLDATLDVSGLPQSGTGQASLFTGVNCARLAGRHYGPYPHSKTREALRTRNLFARIQRLYPSREEPAAFANAYPPRFFSYAQKTDRWTVTTRCCLDSDVRIRTTADLAAGYALPADLTGKTWKERLGLDVDLLSPEEAGRRLLRTSREHRLTLFEYFLTDKTGHSQSMKRAQAILNDITRFLTGILENFAPSDETLLITSDHGNLEDLSTKTHTLHPVPLVAYGRDAGRFARATSILDVTPAIAAALAE